MITRYFNRPYPNHILFLFVFISATSFALISVFWITKPTLAYTLLGLGVACGTLVFFLHRQNHFLEKEAKITKTVDDEFSVARKNFIDIFDDALERLNSKGGEASGILSQTMERHRVAYEKFRRILGKTRESETVSGLDEKWNHYYNDDPIPYATYHATRFKGPDHKSKDQAARDEAVKRINVILKYVDEL